MEYISIQIKGTTFVDTQAGTGDGQAIIKSLQERGTPAENYKISEVDEDIVLDAEPLVIGPTA